MSIAARLEQIAHALPLADGEGQQALIEEAAELLAADDYMSEFDACDVTEEQDERNSRPFPY